MFRARPSLVTPHSALLLSTFQALFKGSALKTFIAKATTFKPALAHGAKWAMRLAPWIRKLEHGKGRTPTTWLRNKLPVPVVRNLRKIYVASALGATGSFAVLVLSSVEYYANGETSRYRLMIYSPEQERLLGNHARAEMYEIHEGQILPEDHPLTISVDQIARRLIDHIEDPLPDPPDWRVHVVDSSAINALAIPSGDIFIYCGMLEAAEDEACCAAVLAHEISHITARHTVERLSMTDIWSIPKNYFYSWMFTDHYMLAGPFNAVAAGVSQLFIDLPFSRGMEMEADLMGLNLVHRSGYDCHLAVKIWSRMKRRNDAESCLSTNEFFSTHPCYTRRIENQMEWLDKLGCAPFPQSGMRGTISSIYLATMRYIGRRSQHQWSFDEWSSHLRYQRQMRVATDPTI